MKIAIIGAGPAGLYTADEICRAATTPVSIDIFERLAAPFGLLRYGVAPDHLKMKSLEGVLERVLERREVRLFGNMQFGLDIGRARLLECYDAIVYATGAPHARTLEIPGEMLPGSAAAYDFVAWYNGMPGCSVDPRVLAARDIAIVGAGNVALDVARLLAKPAVSLLETDAPASVIDALGTAAVRNIHILCRRGPADVRFTPKELQEIGEIPGVAVTVRPEDLPAGPEIEAAVAPAPDALQGHERNLAIFRHWAARVPTAADRRITFLFHATPLAIVGHEGVDALEFTAGRAPIPRRLEVQAVLTSIGSNGVCLPDVPFDPNRRMIPHTQGRVTTPEATSREFVVGWAARGARGVLGTNKSDAMELAAQVLAVGQTGIPRREVFEEPQATAFTRVDLEGWRRIAAAERVLGQDLGRKRCKITSRTELLRAARAGPHSS